MPIDSDATLAHAVADARAAGATSLRVGARALEDAAPPRAPSAAGGGGGLGISVALVAGLAGLCVLGQRFRR